MKKYDHYLCEVTQIGDTLEMIGEENENLVTALYLGGSDQIILITEKPADMKSVKKFLKVEDKEKA